MSSFCSSKNILKRVKKARSEWEREDVTIEISQELASKTYKEYSKIIS